MEMNSETGWDIGVLSVEEAGEPRPVFNSKFNESQAALSPDGNWIAYAAGRVAGGSLYVQPYPDGPRMIVSSEEAFQPRWSRDPEKPELFYRSGNRMVAHAIETEPKLVIGPARELFELDRWAGPTYYSSYDLLPDGRFVLVVEGEDGEQEPREFVVVVNWAEKLRAIGK